jgi:hypothetical protein
VENDPVNFNDPAGLFRVRPAQDVPDQKFIHTGGAPARVQDRQTRVELWQELTIRLNVSEECARGLVTAGARTDAVERANTASEVLKTAAADVGIDWRLLAAVGVRETGFRNIDEIGGGPGRGVFQITTNSAFSENEARDLLSAARYAARLLKTSMNFFSLIPVV